MRIPPLASFLPGPIAAATGFVAQVTDALPDNWLVGTGILVPLVLILARVLVVDSPVAGTARSDRRNRLEAEQKLAIMSERANRWRRRAWGLAFQHLSIDERSDPWGDDAAGRNEWGDREDDRP